MCFDITCLSLGFHLLHRIGNKRKSKASNTQTLLGNAITGWIDCFCLQSRKNFESSHLISARNSLMNRYRIYVDGLAWSVSQKYIMACNSPTLFLDTHWIEFFQRGLVPGHHYWPIGGNNKCRAIKVAVNFGNGHHAEVCTLHCVLCILALVLTHICKEFRFM